MGIFEIILMIVLLPVVITIGFLGSLIKVGKYAENKDHVEYLETLEDK
jgi:hypothetical protein